MILASLVIFFFGWTAMAPLFDAIAPPMSDRERVERDQRKRRR